MSTTMIGPKPQRGWIAGAVTMALFLLPGLLLAQDRSQAEEQAERDRRGAGLRIGAWMTQDLSEVSGADYSTSPHFEGWFQRGLDRHIAIESNLSVWRRVQERDAERVSTFIVPLFTPLTFYPGTGPEATVQPHILAGGGLGLGIDDREGSSGGLLPVGSSEGTRIYTGFGFKGGAGVDLQLSQAFGLSLGGRYQWIRFDGSPGGNRTYKGLVLDAGIVYRFQY